MNDKDVYLNGIMSKMNESNLDEFVFDKGTTLKLWYLGEVVDTKLECLYFSPNNELCIDATIDDDDDGLCTDPLIDFGIDEIKMIYNVFMEQISKRIK